jgi:hypothetical protein
VTGLIPIRYAVKNNSTFFDVAGTLITIGYEVARRKRLFVLPGTVVATVQARIGDETAGIAHQYAIPRSQRVGSEIAHIERGLYGFMDEVIRTTVQARSLESAEKRVAAAEAEHLFFDPALASPDDADHGLASVREAAAAQARFISDLVARVVTAVRHLTNITSLTVDGLEAYQRDRSSVLKRAARSESLTVAAQTDDIIQTVEAFLDYESDGTADVEALQERTRDYLDYHLRRHTSPDLQLGSAQMRVIVNEYVPAFLKLKRKYDAAVSYPKDVAEHAIGSFFGGGFTGWISLSLFGEKILQELAGVYVDIPGWYIGAAVAFVWPYMRAAVAAFNRDKWYEKQRTRLLDRIARRLQLAAPDDA